jgi:hypothetical protein
MLFTTAFDAARTGLLTVPRPEGLTGMFTNMLLILLGVELRRKKDKKAPLFTQRQRGVTSAATSG